MGCGHKIGKCPAERCGRRTNNAGCKLQAHWMQSMIYEYSTGVRSITDEASYRPRQFPFEPSSFCMWGSKPDIPEFRT